LPEPVQTNINTVIHGFTMFYAFANKSFK
jgi:hypothetical protein